MSSVPTLLPAGRTAVMGILNLTPDSFSDGGHHTTPEAALAWARNMIAAGADMIDIGGESTRPGAQPVGEAQELDRVLPVIQAIRAVSDIPLSIDTMKPAVARAAIAAGADIWNDVSALSDPDAMQTARALGVPVILMHMRGDPQTMQQEPRYDDVVREVAAFLLARAQTALDAGIARENIWIDPGVGFGKNVSHNLALLAATAEFAALGYPLVIGASRKRFIAAIDPYAPDAKDRLGGSLVVALHAAVNGASIVRVHDVGATVQALAVQRAIKGGGR